MIMPHVCESCAMQWLDDGADKIMDEAFQREFDEHENVELHNRACTIAGRSFRR
jgi:hypothetical protein